MLAGGGTLHKCKKVTYTGNVGQAMDAVDAVCRGCNGIVLYGSGEVSLVQNRSN